MCVCLSQDISIILILRERRAFASHRGFFLFSLLLSFHSYTLQLTCACSLFIFLYRASSILSPSLSLFLVTLSLWILYSICCILQTQFNQISKFHFAFSSNLTFLCFFAFFQFFLFFISLLVFVLDLWTFNASITDLLFQSVFFFFN